MNTDTTSGGPFGRAAHIYRSAGWEGTLPLGNRPGEKFPPPGDRKRGVTFTGHGAPMPSPADVAAWLETHAEHNIGLRLPAGVIGLDVDAYVKGGKPRPGGETLEGLLERFGELPPTWITSARDDGVSGIRLFRVPLELDGRPINWPGEAGKGIEIIQHGHRYAVVWPSTNPDADGAQYEWRWSEHGRGNRRGDVPAPDDLPPLPEAWVRGLALSYDRTEKSDLHAEALRAWWEQLRTGTAPCPVVQTVLTKAVDELRDPDGSRHELARDRAAALARLGGEGHSGAPNALHTLGQMFEIAVGAERVANGEWARLLNGAVQLAASDNPVPRQHCEHDAVTTVAALEGFDLQEQLQAALRRAEEERREQAIAAAAVVRSRLDEMAKDVESCPFAERAEAVRRLIPEIAGWGPAEQSLARDTLSSKHGMTDLGITEFRALLREEEKGRKAAAEQAAHEEARTRHAEQVAAAVASGALLPPPHAPIDVARALAERLPAPARWWRGDFYRHTGTRYVPWADESVDHFLYRSTERAVYESADDEGGTKQWNTSETRIGAVAHALARGVLFRESEEEPDDAAAQVVCSNGVYDVADGALLPHTPERFNLQSVPFAYDATATAPLWEWFLNDVLPKDAQVFLQEWFGYVLSGRTDLEKIAHLKGLPRSGKGTVATVLETLIGEDAIAAPTIPSLVQPFGEQPLIGKRLAIFSDISWSHRDIVAGVEIVKAISGRDTRDVARKMREVWRGKLPVRFMIMGNDMPKFTDASGALAYRMIHVAFPGTVMGREDPTLKDRLLAEMPGILNWALAGLTRLTANGRFTVPESSRELDAEVRRQQGPVQGFLDDLCARSENANPVPLDELYPVYRAWAAQADTEHKLDRERFSRALQSAGLTVERKMINGVRARRVLGLVPAATEGGQSAWVAALHPAPVIPSA